MRIYYHPLLPLVMRILILEDDSKIADFASNGLKQAGFAVDKWETVKRGCILVRTMCMMQRSSTSCSQDATV